MTTRSSRRSSVLAETKDPGLRLQAVRLIVLGLGDWHLNDPAVEIDTAYSVQPSLAGREARSSRIRDAIRPLFPRSDPLLNEEAGRLLAILEDDDTGLPAQVASLWTAGSSPTRDLHYLIIFSRLRGQSADLTPRVADALLSLDGKLQSQELRIKQTWNDRLAELDDTPPRPRPQARRGPPRPCRARRPGHVTLALCLNGEARVRAAQLFLNAAGQDDDFAWSGPLIELLSCLPAETALPAFRARWDELRTPRRVCSSAWPSGPTRSTATSSSPAWSRTSRR